MSTSSSSLAGWKLCSLTCLAMVLLSLIPQIHLWIVRGRDWNGAYVSPHVDEPLYSAYINALIDGRARKNDPFGGQDNSASAPLPESIFSLQFVPAYAIALPARVFGASASMAFIVLIAVGALLASLSVFWLLNEVTEDPRLATAGTLLVLCFGSIVGRHGIFGTFLDIGIAAFPFLRRYQPAVAFPLFFVFQLLVWRALTGQRKVTARILTVLAGLTLVVLIFSHLYLWTAAAAWLVSICVLWLCFRPYDRRKTSAVLTGIGALAALALLPYIFLLSNRAATLEEQQMLTSTHWPDLLRIHEILGCAILVVLFIGILRNRIERNEPRLLYATSLALLPFIVFNQQIVTGKTLQAFHFEIFVVNYSTVVALLITVTLFCNRLSRRVLIWATGLSLAWGVVAVGLPARVAFVPLAIASDRRVPVLLRLKELSKQDGTLEDLRTKGQASTLVFSPSVSLITQLPTWTSQGTLLDMTGVDCRGMTREERKKLLYMHLYYSRTDIQALREALHGNPDSSHDELSTVRTALFGYERTSPALTFQFVPIREDEIEREVQNYQLYTNSFSREVAHTYPLTYAVIPTEGGFDLANLDRWYKRDAGERVGDYSIFRLKLLQ